MDKEQLEKVIQHLKRHYWNKCSDDSGSLESLDKELDAILDSINYLESLVQ